jgi:hypothetical protein
MTIRNRIYKAAMWPVIAVFSLICWARIGRRRRNKELWERIVEWD